MITQAFYERLANDPTIKSLTSYKGQAAVFTAQPIPSDATLPYIVTVGQVSDETEIAQAAKNRVASHAIRDIRIYAEAKGSMNKIEQIAERVWELFHRQPLEMTGWENTICNASRPVIAPAGKDVYGLVVTVSMINQKL